MQIDQLIAEAFCIIFRVLEYHRGLESIRKSERKLKNKLERSTCAATTTKYCVRNREFMTTLKNKKLLGFSNTRVSKRFGYNSNTKIYNRNKNNQFRALYIKTRNLLYKRSL
jgi:hypothetical protein